MIIMSVDYGKSRTGIAVCDKSEILASPVAVIPEKVLGTVAKKAAEEAQRLGAELIVVGLPRRTDGKEGETEQLAKEFARLLEKRTGIKCEMWDERFTTVSAHMALNEMNVTSKKRKEVVDALAAVIILENYLEYRHNVNKM